LIDIVESSETFAFECGPRFCDEDLSSFPDVDTIGEWWIGGDIVVAREERGDFVDKRESGMIR
jgi:hypothetical protein